MDTGEEVWFGHEPGDWFDQRAKDSGGVFQAGGGAFHAEACEQVG